MRDILRPSMRLAIVFLMALFMPAHAALIVCNKSAHGVKVAVGRFNGASWLSAGWWALTPKACATVVSGVLNARYYYIYASDGGSGSWAGPRNFCTSQGDKFEIIGRNDCQARGFDRKGFFEVDTGTLADYTQSLSD